MKKYYIVIIFCFLYVFILKAQIGINTESPSTLLDIVSSSSTTLRTLVLSNSDDKETLLIRNDGYIGMGVANPLVKLDLRSSTLTNGNALGIGYTSKTAVQAGAGAIRYNATDKTLEYSDGTTWVRLQSNPDRAMVIAKVASHVFTPNSGNIIGTYLRNWTTIYDKTGNFNSVTGVFVAPRDGIYSAAITGVFDNATIGSGGQYELTLGSSSGVALKSVVPYLSAITNSNITNVCKALFYLQKGQTLSSQIYIAGVQSTIKFSSDASLNTLTIAEM